MGYTHWACRTDLAAGLNLGFSSAGFASCSAGFVIVVQVSLLVVQVSLLGLLLFQPVVVHLEISLDTVNQLLSLEK